MKSRGDFWALMFLVVALANGVFYFTSGWTTNIISQVKRCAESAYEEWH